jgi:hypothetical protein
MERNNSFLGVIVATLVVVGAVIVFSQGPAIKVDDAGIHEEDVSVKMIQREPTQDNGMVDMSAINPDFAGLEVVFSADLADVTQGQEVRGTQFDGMASGMFRIGFVGEMFGVEAEFYGLPDIVGTDFYEGWLVRPEPFDFVSTGVVTKEGDNYVNRYLTEVDLSTYTKYVLTIEPDDGDPRPAEHVVEN